MPFEVVQKESVPGQEDDGRDFVTDGVDIFHVDRSGAQRLADLLNNTVKAVVVAKKRGRPKK